jgi:hypothetical protein
LDAFRLLAGCGAMASTIYAALMVWLIMGEISLIWFIECAPLEARSDD